VGEGGDPGGEYIIPAKKMAGASMAYLSGARGASVIPGFAKGGYVGRTTSIAAVTRSNKSGNGGPSVTITRLNRGDENSSPLEMLVNRVGPINTPINNQPSSVANDRPINITTGPILEFNGQRYVTIEEYQRGLRDVKRQTLGEMRTAAGRRATGR
jgi:hypothetical protein